MGNDDRESRKPLFPITKEEEDLRRGMIPRTYAATYVEEMKRGSVSGSAVELPDEGRITDEEQMAMLEEVKEGVREIATKGETGGLADPAPVERMAGPGIRGTTLAAGEQGVPGDDRASRRPSITEEEKARRRKVISGTDANLRLSGITRGEENARDAELWTEGEITREEKMQRVKDRLRRIAEKNGVDYTG